MSLRFATTRQENVRRPRLPTELSRGIPESFDSRRTDIEDAVVPGQEDVVVRCIHDRGEVRIERDGGFAADQRPPSEVLEPALRALDAIEPTVRAVGVWHRCALGASDDGEVPADDDGAVEGGRIGPRDAVGRADDGCGAGRRGGADQAVPFRGETVDRESASSRPSAACKWSSSGRTARWHWRLRRREPLPARHCPGLVAAVDGRRVREKRRARTLRAPDRTIAAETPRTAAILSAEAVDP